MWDPGRTVEQRYCAEIQQTKGKKTKKRPHLFICPTHCHTHTHTIRNNSILPQDKNPTTETASLGPGVGELRPVRPFNLAHLTGSWRKPLQVNKNASSAATLHQSMLTMLACKKGNMNFSTVIKKMHLHNNLYSEHHTFMLCCPLVAKPFNKMVFLCHLA